LSAGEIGGRQSRWASCVASDDTQGHYLEYKWLAEDGYTSEQVSIDTKGRSAKSLERMKKSI
jgi:hypothetical protein